MDIVKLQGRDSPCVTDQTPAHEPTPQIPEPDHAVRRTARKRRVKDLHCAYKVGFGIQCPSRDGFVPALAASAEATLSGSTKGRGRRRSGQGRGLSGCPQDIECLDASACLEVPLAESLVG